MTAPLTPTPADSPVTPSVADVWKRCVKATSVSHPILAESFPDLHFMATHDR